MTLRSSSPLVHPTATAGRYLRRVDQLGLSSPDELRWELTYERTSVERFIAEIDEEVARLRTEIEAARQRAAAARSGSSARDDGPRSALSELVLAAQRELAAIEAEHERLVVAIRGAAEAEAVRVIVAARAEAAAADAAAEEITTAVRPHDHEPADLDSCHTVHDASRDEGDAG